MLKLAGEPIEGQLAGHLADLDAHTRNIFEKVRTGQYLTPFWVGTVATGNAALVANQLYATALLIPRDMTLDRICFEVTTAGAGGTKARLGIYNDGTDLYPGALLVDAGEVAVDTTGLKTIIISQALTKGIYWLAVVTDGTPKTYYETEVPNILGDSTSLYRTRAGWRVAHTYAALPDPFTAGGAVENYVWRLGFRVASLD